MHFKKTLAALALVFGSGILQAETIRIAIGTQDTTINCATDGGVPSLTSA